MIRRNAPRFARFAALLAVPLFAALSAGCAAAPPAKEKTSQEWYDEGSRLAAKKKYDDALDAFKQAAGGYRGADLDADIQISLADTYFNQESYPAAVEAYTEFLRLHPHNARADYAQYRIGLSWQKQMRSAERSPEPASKAAAAYDALLRGYPRSALLEEGRAGLAAARTRLAEHELCVADFYRRTEKFQAAAGRYELVLRDYSDIGLSDRALYGLGSCYRRLQDVERSEQLFEQLRREHPQSQFLKEIDASKG